MVPYTARIVQGGLDGVQGGIYDERMLESMSESDLAGIEHEITALLDRLDRLYEEAAAAIDATTDPEQAFALATDLADTTRQVHDRIAGRLARLRARQVVRIRDRESLSLAQLAGRISVSKARADQLVRDATKEVTP